MNTRALMLCLGRGWGALPLMMTFCTPAPETPLVATADPRLPPEPRYPPPCTTLLASKVVTGSDLTAEDEDRPDTDRLQAALEACPAGQAVKLGGDGDRNAFLSGPLRLVHGVTLWVDAGVTLFASRNPRDYDVSAGSCGIVDASGKGCRPFITIDVTDAAIMGEGIIDGRGDGLLIGQTQSWWDLGTSAKELGQTQNCPRLIVARHADNLVLYQITLQNSPNFHVLAQADGLVAWGVKIRAPSRAVSPSGAVLTARSAHNTDGIDPSACSNVTIAYCSINVGDDHVALKGGGPVSNVTVAHNHFYAGHGMSIGSETQGGVSNVRVYDLTIDMQNNSSGSPNGLRIKSDLSRGGLVQGIDYSDVCMRDVANPIVLTSHYSTAPGTSIPTFQDLTFTKVRSTRSPGSTATPSLTFDGADADHRLTATLSNVVIEGATPKKITASFATLTLGPDPVNFRPSGSGVIIVDQVGTNAPASDCTDRFVPFPDAR